jgi:hypothetical protein
MANNWKVINSNQELWLLFVSSQHLKWNWRVEKIGSVWKDCSLGEYEVFSSNDGGGTLDDSELSWIFVVSIESDFDAHTVLSVREAVLSVAR